MTLCAQSGSRIQRFPFANCPCHTGCIWIGTGGVLERNAICHENIRKFSSWSKTAHNASKQDRVLDEGLLHKQYQTSTILEISTRTGQRQLTNNSETRLSRRQFFLAKGSSLGWFRAVNSTTQPAQSLLPSPIFARRFQNPFRLCASASSWARDSTSEVQQISRVRLLLLLLLLLLTNKTPKYMFYSTSA